MMVAKYLVDVAGCSNLADFKSMFTKPEDAGVKVISKIEGLAKPLAEESRLIQAWEACTSAAEVAKTRKAQGMEADEDAVLGSEELDEFRTKFYVRYKLHFHSEWTVGDRILSRLIREVRKNNLALFDMWKLVSLANQALSDRKKRRISHNLELLDDTIQVEAQHTRNAEVYLDLLEIYLLGLATAGVEPRVPPPSGAEAPGNSVEFVTVPLDVILNYHRRAKVASSLVPEMQRLQWVQTRDEAERKIWVEKIRMPGNRKTLGEIIAATAQAREQSWVFEPRPAAAAGGQSQSGAAAIKPTPKSLPAPSTPPKGPPAGSGAVVGSFAKTTKDGTAICAAWNSGGCTAKGPCSGNKLHVCAVIAKQSGRVCGLNNHRGCEHAKGGKKQKP